MKQKQKSPNDNESNDDTSYLGTDSEAERLLKRSKKVASEAKEAEEAEAREKERQRRYRRPVTSCCGSWRD